MSHNIPTSPFHHQEAILAGKKNKYGLRTCTDTPKLDER